MEPFDPNLNAAIIAIAKRLFPDGFDVSDEAPDTYQKLKTHLDAGKRMLEYGGGSQHTIYADPTVNHAFRAWHDWTHWTGRHELTFQGEKAVCADQRLYLMVMFGRTREIDRWSAIINAEVIGQSAYFKYHKRFPINQRPSPCTDVLTLLGDTQCPVDAARVVVSTTAHGSSPVLRGNTVSGTGGPSVLVASL